MFNQLEKHKNLGFLILRIGVGLMFMFHGYGKLQGGAMVWEKVGSAMGNFGITFGHQFFGLLATLSEFLGGLCFALGLFFRPACFFLTSVMVVAATMHLKNGDGLNVASHAIEAGFVFLGFLFIGAGPDSLDEKLKKK